MNKKLVHGGNIYDTSPTGEWLDFSANINPLGLADTVRQSLAAHGEDIIHYPDTSGRKLKEALCACYPVRQEELLLGNGAAELFYLYFHAFPGRRVILPVPSFGEYERAAQAGRSDITYIFMRPGSKFVMPWKSLYEAMPRGGTIVLGNPNNPTGTLCAASDLLQLVQAAAEAETDVIVDESFLDFLDETPYSLLMHVRRFDNLFVIRSMTKSLAIPGLRLGFAAVPQEKIPELEQHKDVWSVNVLAQCAGAAALADQAYQERSRQYVQQEKDWLYQQLQELPDIHVFLPTVNFILIRLGRSWKTGERVGKALRRQGILIRDCQYYPGLTAQYIRVAVRTRRENMALVTAMTQYIRTKKM